MLILEKETKNQDQTKRVEIQKEALEAVLPYARAGLHVSMGVGKTYIGLQYISTLHKGGKILVVAPKVSIFESWKIDAGKFNLTHLLDDIIFTTYISLTKHYPGDYEILILDEAHNAKSSHALFLDMFSGRILGLTGTPPKYKFSEKGIIMNNFYPIRFSYTVTDAVDEQILNDYRIIVHKVSLGTSNTVLAGNKAKQFYTSETKNYEWLNKSISSAQSQKDIFIRRIMLLNALKQFETKVNFVSYVLAKIPYDDKCIVFANTTDQADRICTYSYHSKNTKVANQEVLDNFSKGEIRRIAAVEQLSEGINIPNLKHIVIMHSYGNEKKASQKIGRALRLNKDEVATIHVLCYADTVDELWVESSLEEFDETKIRWVDWTMQNNQFIKL